MATNPRQHLGSLDLMRGLAALLVMLFHISGEAFENLFAQRPVGDAFAFGYAGLDFFFVLSGFIIVHVHRADIGQPARLGAYAWSRLTRIYPAYWVVTLAYAALLTLGGLMPTPQRFVASMLLIPDGPLLLGVAWTLCHELLFYAVFALVIAAPRLGTPVAAAWLLGSVLVPKGDSAALDFLFNLRHLEFALGAAVAWNLHRPLPLRPLTLAALGAGLFTATAILDVAGTGSDPNALILLYGLSSGIVILGAVRAEMAGHFPVAAPFRLLGSASYAIYLTHLLAYSISGRIAKTLHLPDLLPGWALLILLSVILTLAGIAFHLLVEQPLLRLTRATGRLILQPAPVALRR